MADVKLIVRGASNYVMGKPNPTPAPRVKRE